MVTALTTVGQAHLTPPAGGGPGLTLAAIGANPEVMSLLRFAVSDDYDDLSRELES